MLYNTADSRVRGADTGHNLAPIHGQGYPFLAPTEAISRASAVTGGKITYARPPRVIAIPGKDVRTPRPPGGRVEAARNGDEAPIHARREQCRRVAKVIAGDGLV